MPCRSVLVLLAALALSLGLLVYVLDRAPGSAYLLPRMLQFGGATWTIFGAIGGCLPSFFHTFAFSLLTSLALGSTRRALYFGCGSWWVIGTLFEIGQHPAIRGPLTATFPDWFNHWPLFDHLAGYFLHGTFDPFDLLATAVGAIAAGFVLNIYLRQLTKRERSA